MARKKKSETGTIEVSLTVPLAPRGTGYEQQHIDLQLNAAQAATMRRLRDALEADGAKLESGRTVFSGADVVRFMLETMAKAETEANGELSGL